MSCFNTLCNMIENDVDKSTWRLEFGFDSEQASISFWTLVFLLELFSNYFVSPTWRNEAVKSILNLSFFVLKERVFWRLSIIVVASEILAIWYVWWRRIKNRYLHSLNIVSHVWQRMNHVGLVSIDIGVLSLYHLYQWSGCYDLTIRFLIWID